jgi:hypothetical protein
MKKPVEPNPLSQLFPCEEFQVGSTSFRVAGGIVTVTVEFEPYEVEDG